MNKPAREVELKLAVPDGSVGELLHHAALQTLPAQPTERRHERTTYFDTPDGLLAQRGISLRVRCSEGGRVQTVKANGRSGAAADRAEWEWTIWQDTPDLSLLEQTGIGHGLPAGLDVGPLISTDINRTVRMLALDDGTLVEAALDEGAIIAGSARQPVRELELELRAGDAVAIYRLALALHATTPLTIVHESKASRGYRLRRGGGAPQASKAERMVLSHGVSAAAAFCQTISAALGHLLVNRPAALSGDAEGVHQMRIAIRRLRAALNLFKPYLEAHARCRFERELRRLGRVFGAARDWDVFCLQILPGALEPAGATAWHELLRQPAMVRRAAAHRCLALEVGAPGFTGLVLGLAAWAEQGGAAVGYLGDAALEAPVERLAPPLLDRLADKVQQRGRRIGQHSDVQRHALRKSLKKLRYGIDDVEALFDRKAVKRYLHAGKKLQQTLGDINDSVAALGLAEQLADATRPDLAPAVGALATHLERRRADELRGLSKRWKRFRAVPRFWV